MPASLQQDGIILRVDAWQAVEEALDRLHGTFRFHPRLMEDVSKQQHAKLER
ncbi:MAG: hypothetical protein ACYDCO_09205 [Armatimonadota bacterium]